MFKDFRDLLDHFEKNGRLLRIKQEVDVNDFKIPAAIRNVSDTDGPALLFEKIKGFPSWRVAGGIYANRKLTTLGLRIDEDKLLEFFHERYDKRIKPVMVSNGPVKEVVWKGDDIDLFKIPIVTHSEHDRGPVINGYISAGVQIAKIPGTQMRETAMVRLTPLNKNTITLWRGGGHIREMMNTAEKRGQGLEIATVLGVEPSLAHASQLYFPHGEVDELEAAGALRGAPLELVKCETIDLEVPANAEIVIEHVCIPNERHPDGPYGEFHGTYGGSPEVPVTKVTAITMRKDPIYETLLTGMPLTENQWLTGPSRRAMAYRNAKRWGANVVDAIITGGSSHTNHAIVSIRKRHEEEPRQIIATLLGTGHGVTAITRVTVVDDDINIHDPFDVEWAINNRMMPDRGIIIIPGVYGFDEARTHATSRGVRPGMTGAKWGIDATMPLRDNFGFQKVYVPGQEKVDWRKGENMFEKMEPVRVQRA